MLVSLLGIPLNDEKFAPGQVVTVFGYELDSTTFVMRLPSDKLAKVRDAVRSTRAKKKLSLWDVQVISGLLSWSAPAVQLGWVFLPKLWDF
jgi:hypothetical protein